MLYGIFISIVRLDFYTIFLFCVCYLFLLMKIYVNVVQDFEIYMKNRTKKLYSENCYSLKEFISLRKEMSCNLKK